VRPLARLALALTGTLACADEPTLEPVPLGEVCGQQGPVRLLELPPGRQLVSYTQPFRLGDRRYFRTSQGTVDDIGNPGDDDLEIWSTGLCGESPYRLATDLRFVATTNNQWPQRLQSYWQDILVGCRSEDARLVILDPESGAAAPLMPATTCHDALTEHGTVVLTANEGEPFAALWLHPYPEDPRDEPPPPRLLHPELRLFPAIPDPAIKRQHILTILPDAVLAIDADDRLLRIDLVDASVTPEADDVLAFRVSADDRYLLRQSPTTPGTDPTFTASTVILDDRHAGTSVALGQFALAYSDSPFEFLPHGLMHVYVDDHRHLRVFHLPGLEFVDLWPDRFEAVLADGRWLLSNAKDIKLYDEARGDASFAIQAEGHILARDQQRVLHLARDVTRADTQGPVHHVPFAHLEARRLAAPRATAFARLLDGSRLLTPVELDSDGRGELLLVDLDTADEQRIDTHVPAAAFRLDAGFGPNHLVYSVDDGPRSGIYVAHLPASE
jgi:hypothetical protein